MARILTAAPAGDGHQDTAPLLKNGQIYTCKLSEITDTQKRKFESEEYKDAYRLVFEVYRKNGEAVGTISKKFFPSIHKQSALYPVIEALTGAAPVSGFDIDSMIGKQCRITIKTWTTDQGIERNGIGSVLPAEDDDDMPIPSKLETTNIQARV